MNTHWRFSSRNTSYRSTAAAGTPRMRRAPFPVAASGLLALAAIMVMLFIIGAYENAHASFDECFSNFYLASCDPGK